ncbi:MAG TPA: CBS domain-containing protein [Polyangiaceae bacterium]
MSKLSEHRSEKRHPILTARVTRADGTQALALRVYCGARGCSVPLATCRNCDRCHEVREAGAASEGCVICSPPIRASAYGEPVRVGDVLHKGIVGVEDDVLVADVVRLFVERSLRVVVVTDRTGKFIGLLREADLLPEIMGAATPHRSLAPRLGRSRVVTERAAALTSPIRSVPESMSLRAALTDMAAARHRQILAVDGEGLPVGMLEDFEALHALFAPPQA